MDLAFMAPSRVGDGANHTALLYNSRAFRLVDTPTLRGEGAFHHALIRAVFRPVGREDARADFLVLATHLNPFDGDARLGEARYITDYGGAFPGMPPRAVWIGDLNTPDREPPGGWDAVPTNLHSRYRLVLPDGTFGGADQRALRVPLQSGWQDPHDLLGITRPPTVGHYYPNERVPWALDYALVAGLDVAQVFTHPWDIGFRLSDHLPHGVDVVIPS